MKRKLILLICLLELILLPACREAPSAEASAHLYADYYVRYLAATRELRAEARFVEGPDPQTAAATTIDGSLLFLEEVMELEAADEKKPRYTWSGARTFPSELFFQYERANNRYRQEMTMHPLQHFTVQRPFRKQEGLLLTARGSLLKGNETLVLLLADMENRAFSYTIEGPAADSTHRIPPDALSGIPPGPAILYLVKRMKKTIEQPHQTVTATIEYYTDTLQIRVLE